MRKTDQTLLRKMRITDLEIVSRKELFSITKNDESVLKSAKPYIEKRLDTLVNLFYEMQTDIPEIALLIGDSDTFDRLRNMQSKYILDLFSGYYDIEYVNHRLSVGLVHKRIGVGPKLYLANMQTLKELLFEVVQGTISDTEEQTRVIKALHKLIMFDISLVFDTYIRSMASETDISKGKSDYYASLLEEKVKERTIQLEKLSRTDPLTGLLNTRHLAETLTQVLRTAQQHNESITVAYIDVNDFKIINDTQGHLRGDEILQTVANALKAASRLEDYCFRYGGDEFCVVMPNCQMDNAKKVWEWRVLQLIQKQENHLSLSIGYAQTGPNEYVSAQMLIRQADEQMYRTKRAMKNRYAA